MGRFTFILSLGFRSNYGDMSTPMSSVNERISAGPTTFTNGNLAEYEAKYLQEEIFSLRNLCLYSKTHSPSL